MSKMNKIDFSKLKVEIQLRNKGTMKGQAAIEYQGIRITHFRFMHDSQTNEYFVQMPSLKVFSKYQRMFWIIDENDVEAFEQLLLTRFIEFREKVKNREVEDNHPSGEIDDEFF